MSDNFQDALDIQEMEKSAGWILLKNRIEEEIESWEEELRSINTRGKGPEEVGAEYIRCVQSINGLKRILEIVEDIKAQKHNGKS